MPYQIFNSGANCAPFAAVVGIAALSVGAAHAAGSAGAPDGIGFLSDAIRADIAAVELGRLAEDNAQSRAVRRYGHALSSGSAKAMKEAATLAKTLGLTVPTAPSSEAAQEYDTLFRLSGPVFDRTFLGRIVAARRQDIAHYRERANSGGGEIAELAAAALPVLEKQLDAAESLQRELQSNAAAETVAPETPEDATVPNDTAQPGPPGSPPLPTR